MSEDEFQYFPACRLSDVKDDIGVPVEGPYKSDHYRY